MSISNSFGMHSWINASNATLFWGFGLFFLSSKSLLLQKLPFSREGDGLAPGGDSVHLLITLNEYSSDVGKPLYWVGVSSKFPWLLQGLPVFFLPWLLEIFIQKFTLSKLFSPMDILHLPGQSYKAFLTHRLHLRSKSALLPWHMLLPHHFIGSFCLARISR